MAKFAIQPHGRLQEWIAHENGYFRDAALDYEFRGGLCSFSLDRILGESRCHSGRAPRKRGESRNPVTTEQFCLDRARTTSHRRCLLGPRLRGDDTQRA